MVQQLTIIVFEDNDIDYRILEKAFALSPCCTTFIRYSSGDVGIEELAKRDSFVSIDAIFIDLGLPGVSGEDVLCMIKKNQKINDVPLYIWSGLPESYKVQALSQKYTSDVIDKNLTIDKVKNIIQDIQYKRKALHE